MAILLLGAGCGDPAAEAPPAPASEGVRGKRYCEILIGDRDGELVRVEVYNTFGLNDCPAEAWETVDIAAVQAELGADIALLNGPRHWLLDAFVDSELADPTVVVLGGIEMRKAAVVELTLAEAAAMDSYARREIQRHTTFVFDAGKPIHELVDPAGDVFVMQSYSLEHAPLDEAALAGLEATLALPAGWGYATRVLEAPLEVTAVDDVAVVVQDELENTYQLAR